MGSLDDRVVLVTGGGSGIGRAACLAIVARGGRVVAVDRDAGGAAETEAQAVAAGGDAFAVAADVADEAAVQNAVAATVERFGRLDGVLTCAGIFDPPDLQPLADVTLETFNHVLSVNLAGTFLAIKHALPHLLRDESASCSAIVTIASTAALRGHGFGSGYTASKGGVAALTRLAAVQYGPQGVRANCICPGAVDTPMAGGAWDSDKARAEMKRTVPLGHAADPAEIATVAAFLLGPDAEHVTGQTIAVDGGVTIT